MNLESTAAIGNRNNALSYMRSTGDPQLTSSGPFFHVTRGSAEDDIVSLTNYV